jgi:hypothetical protein
MQGDPPALPGRQQEFDIFESMLHSLSIGFEKDVYVHEVVDVAVNGFLRMWLAIRPL